MAAPSRSRPGSAATPDQARAAPLGRRSCAVLENRESGAYRIFSVLDPDGPAPAAGQFYMHCAEAGWEGVGGRPYLSRAFSVADAEAADEGVRLDFLADVVGPGSERLAAIEPGERLGVTGPLGIGFSAPAALSAPAPDQQPGAPARSAGGAILVGGGIGIAPLAIWRRQLAEAGIPTRVLLGFRDREHYGGTDLFDCSEVRIATEDGHAGHRGRVTELLAVLLAGDSADGAAVYACGPPAMLEAVREMCRERCVVAELALEAPMACGFGACFGCAVPLADGGYMRLCLEGPVVNAAAIAAVPCGPGGAVEEPHIAPGGVAREQHPDAGEGGS